VLSIQHPASLTGILEMYKGNLPGRLDHKFQFSNGKLFSAISDQLSASSILQPASPVYLAFLTLEVSTYWVAK
jgi:hypothetical protein